MRRTSYYRNIHQNPQLRLCWFLPMIKRAVETGKGVRTTKPIPLNGMDYTLYFEAEVKPDEDDIIILSLKWDDEGDTYRQEIPILKEESNLIAGSYVYFFQDYPYKCKKLFYIGNLWLSRRFFRYIYSSQNLSRREREMRHRTEPFRKYGKEYYRGKLTPYGKRCKRYEYNEERAEYHLIKLGMSFFKKHKK